MGRIIINDTVIGGRVYFPQSGGSRFRGALNGSMYRFDAGDFEVWNKLTDDHWSCLFTVHLNTLRPRRHFADDIFVCIFLNENTWIPIISLKFVPNCPVNNIPALVQIMAWCRPGEKPLSDPMMVELMTHMCVTRPQWIENKTLYTITEIYVSIEAIQFNMYSYNHNFPDSHVRSRTR